MPTVLERVFGGEFQSASSHLVKAEGSSGLRALVTRLAYVPPAVPPVDQRPLTLEPIRHPNGENNRRENLLAALQALLRDVDRAGELCAPRACTVERARVALLHERQLRGVEHRRREAERRSRTFTQSSPSASVPAARGRNSNGGASAPTSAATAPPAVAAGESAGPWCGGRSADPVVRRPGHETAPRSLASQDARR